MTNRKLIDKFISKQLQVTILINIFVQSLERDTHI